MKAVSKIKEYGWIVKSKGMLAGILLIIYSIYEYASSGNFDVNKFLTGLGILGIRHAIHKNANNKK